MPTLPRSLRWRWVALALFAVTTLAGGMAFDSQQRKWIFQAPQAPNGTPAQVDGLEAVSIASSDPNVKLHALWAAGPTPDAPVLLYLHGARRSVEGSTARIGHMQALGFAVLAIEYRGFRQDSAASLSEASVDADARAGWAWIKARYPEHDRYIFGHSLGGAIAVRLASEVTDAKGLIVEGTFTSIPAVFKTMKWGWLPVTPLITQRFDSLARISTVTVPVLVVHGEADTVVPPALGRALYEGVTAPKRFVLVKDGTHHNTNGLGQRQYREALLGLFGVGT